MFSYFNRMVHAGASCLDDAGLAICWGAGSVQEDGPKKWLDKPLLAVGTRVIPGTLVNIPQITKLIKLLGCSSTGCRLILTHGPMAHMVVGQAVI